MLIVSELISLYRSLKCHMDCGREISKRYESLDSQKIQEDE